MATLDLSAQGMGTPVVPTVHFPAPATPRWRAALGRVSGGLRYLRVPFAAPQLPEWYTPTGWPEVTRGQRLRVEDLQPEVYWMLDLYRANS